MDPFNQTITLHGPGGQTMVLWLPAMDRVQRQLTSTAINYSVQMGASLVMLAVLLTLTSRVRFGRASTVLHAASLLVSTVRCLFLALYFTSSYVSFYSFYGGDHSQVARGDINVQAAASFLAVPQLLLIEAALMLQAWALVRMWPAGRRATLVAVSGIVVVPALAFRIFRVVQYMRATLNHGRAHRYVWLVQCDLAFSTATVFWFCLVFITRLVMHMWTCRSVLPPISHLSSMEVLVMTNGVLMLIPVIFAAMEFGSFTNFESGSLMLTSVVIVLPLGTLIAQHMTDEAARRIYGRVGASENSGSGYTRTSDTAASNKKRFLGSWSHASDSTALVSGGLATQVSIHTGSRHKNKAVGKDEEQELQQMDLVEEGTAKAKRVWVGHEIEVRQDAV
ncbi:mating-type alpha-pheromone receptor [Grosmannia clavigera kw1407]|uniref:Mating-type alpha-pheromone receptor n=1 Tax=Grosmannia clavigera (strain kw1407 / UAMH 11150) TaxID=655863 RepID=F0XDY3_GROCL|nr:mating-type alpha-pheromone receptor [Grosmannia clavigera kw1407]EFX04461.1 mating-type alpha-pheromone receptor [Grosmannia clavigera kw1407]